MDINEEIKQNLGLVYKQLWRFNLADDPDAESYAYEALYRSVITFSAQSGNAFSTYAVCVISNALRQYLRSKNKKKQIETISIYTPVNGDESLSLADTISAIDTPEDIVCATELRIAANDAIQRIFAAATQKHYVDIITMWQESDYRATQKEIADRFGISQAIVSRTISNFKYKLRVELEDYL